MIAHLRGKLIYKQPGQAVVEAAGVGYDVTISVPTFTALPSVGAEASLHIRRDVWAKLWGNMNMNPLSALTRCGSSRMLGSPDIRNLCVRMMEEMEACARHLDLQMSMTPAERMAVTQRLGDFKTSMLADLEAGRPLELDPQLGAVVEIAQRLEVAAPFMRSVLALTRLIDPAHAR